MFLPVFSFLQFFDALYQDSVEWLSKPFMDAIIKGLLMIGQQRRNFFINF